MKRVYRRVILALASAAVLSLPLLASQGGATARPSDASPPSATAGETEALEHDLEESDGLTGRTLSDLETEVAFTRAVTDFEERFSENFFGSGVPAIDPKDPKDSVYWITLKTEPNQAESEAIQEFPVDVDVRTTAVGSSTELEVATHKIWSELTARFGRDDGIMVGPATDGSAVEVQYDEKAISSEEITAVTENIRAGLRDVPIMLEPTGEIKTTDFATMRGGGSLYLLNGVFQCTSGFTIDRNNGKAGLITAEHCGHSLKYGGAPGALTYGTTATGDVDMQFQRKTSGNSVKAEFYSNVSYIRDVYASGNAPANSDVCIYGESGGYDCGTVVKRNFCTNACGLDAIDGTNAIPGDSGGPAFLGYDARGIIKGEADLPKYGYVDVITRIGRVANGLNGTVRTK